MINLKGTVRAWAQASLMLALSMPTFAAQSPEFNAFVNAQPSAEARYIVKFKNVPGMSPLASSVQNLAQQRNLLSARGVNVKRTLNRHNAMSVALDRSQLVALRALPEIEYIEADPRRHLMAQVTPWGIGAVQASAVADDDTASRKVCIIDSGYDISNPDLVNNNHSGTNVSGTGNWYVPGGSHGSHVAGTIAAFNNSEGVVGVMPNGIVGIHVVKVFNADGWGYASDLISAIGVCEDAGAQVVNMSLGGSDSSNTERNALQSYADNGMLLIAASGNDGDTSFSYPASYNSVVSVAAVDENLDHADFSQATSQVELSGPGEAVLSTVGTGDGYLGRLNVAGSSYGDDRIVPHNRYILVGGNYQSQMITGQASGTLSSCSVSGGGNYSCGNMSGRICLAERFGNQTSGVYPDIDAVLACANAGAAGVIVYSNSSLPGLQNPFLVDTNSAVSIPSVSVSRALGLQLLNQVGSSATVTISGGEDYAYYNGTSMATPHVTGVAALVWSYDTSCSAAQIRSLLTSTALDIDSAGRDNRTGYGLVQAAAAVDELLLNGCGGGGTGGGSTLENGVAVTGLSGATNSETVYSLEVPQGASNLSFTMSGGSGDADLYVRFGSEPTLSSYDCRPYLNGNNETCSFSAPQAGTYYVKLVGYSAYSGVTLLASYSEGGGSSSSFENATDYAIPDNSQTGVYSPIDVVKSGTAGTVTVDVDIVHTYIGDLIVDLIAPNGTVVNLHNRTGGSSNNINTSYTVNFGNITASGQWRLRVRDRARWDTGYIDYWQITFN
ncbi:serine protease [Alteromonadaceae bacterium 2753L.S.0a.02]|nr:serine protease [Alteromonadaceae bacterium 2753L.S.0a.02]